MQKDGIKKSILLLALHYYDDEESMLFRICKNGVSAAHHTLLNNLIYGLKEYCDITVVSALPVGSFPVMSSQLIIKGCIHNRNNEIGYINLPVVKDKMREMGAKRAIREWIKEQPDNSDKYILIYDSVIPFMKAATAVCLEYPSLKSAIIIPDLPGEFSIENNSYTTVINYWLKKKADHFYKIINKIDGFIPLTRHMLDVMGLNDRPHMIMECITSLSDKDTITAESEDKHVIMYSGELSENVDLDVLLNAINLINNGSVELWICGRGPMEQQIKELTEINHRIKYLGFIPKRELYNVQKEVSVFVNPRQNGHNYSKYSFPSKNAEYLITGKPVVAYKLEGIPDDYDDFIFYPDSNSAESLAKTLEKVLALDKKELIQLGYAQKRFMDENKSAVAQAKNIISFFDSINKNI